MANFINGVAKGLNLSPAANTLSSYLISSGKKEQQAQAEEQKRQKDLADWQYRQNYTNQLNRLAKADELRQKTEALSNYLKGGTTEKSDMYTNDSILNPNVPLKPYQKDSFVPYTPEQKGNLLLGLGYTPNQVINEIQPKKEYSTYIQKPNQTLGLNKATGQLEVTKDYGDQTNPGYVPKYIERPLNTGVLDSKTNKLRIDYGNYDPLTNKWQMDANNRPISLRPQYINITKEGTNGEKLLSEDIKNIHKDFFTTQQSLLAKIKGLENGLPPVDKNGKYMMMPNPDYLSEDTNISNQLREAKEIPVTKEFLQNQLKSYDNQYQNQILNLSSKNFHDWYKNVDKNITADEYWNQLKDAFISGKFTNTIEDPKTGKTKKDNGDKEFELGVELYKAKYGKDPREYYRNNNNNMSSQVNYTPNSVVEPKTNLSPELLNKAKDYSQFKQQHKETLDALMEYYPEEDAIKLIEAGADSLIGGQ